MSSARSPVPAPPPDRLLPGLRRLLRPLVALLIRCGVTFPVLTDLLRGLYVEVALGDLLPDAASRTDSRVSVLTGVHRKEIRRLRGLPPAGDAAPQVLTLSSQIMARWLGAPGYQDAAGAPLALPRAAPAPSFEALVASVTSDVRPRAVLDDWLSQGLVSQGADGLLRLEQAAYLPRPGQDEQLFYFARNLHDHLAAAAANVLAAGKPPFVDRSVHYDRLSEAVAARLYAEAGVAAQDALVRINRLAIALTDAETPEADAVHRVNFGVYVYQEPAPASEPGQPAP